jgi:hypothetical protein
MQERVIVLCILGGGGVTRLSNSEQSVEGLGG